MLVCIENMWSERCLGGSVGWTTDSWFQLRSWSHDPGIKPGAPPWASHWVWSLVEILSLPLPLPLFCLCSLFLKITKTTTTNKKKKTKKRICGLIFVILGFLNIEAMCYSGKTSGSFGHEFTFCLWLSTLWPSVSSQVTNHPSLSGSPLALALKVLCQGNPSGWLVILQLTNKMRVITYRAVVQTGE